MPKTTSVKHVLSEMAALIDSPPTSAHKREAEMLLAFLLDMPRQNFLFKEDIEVPEEVYEAAIAFAKRRAQSEPIAKIIGKKEFWSLEFKVTGDTLDPRPDSECLIETVLEHCSDKDKAYRVLDLGTGSGCLVLSLLSEFVNASAMALDISSKALAIARYNAQNLQLQDRVEFKIHDWADTLGGKYDIIVSNPPYITEAEFETLSEDVKGFDPYSALVSGPTGLEDYEKIVKILDNNLASDGLFAIELGEGQVKDVQKIIKHHNLQALGVRKDIAGIARCIFGKKTLPI